MKCAWGLGFNSYNQEEYLVVYMGMKLLKRDKPLSVIIIGDLEFILKAYERSIKTHT